MDQYRKRPKRPQRPKLNLCPEKMSFPRKKRSDARWTRCLTRPKRTRARMTKCRSRDWRRLMMTGSRVVEEGSSRSEYLQAGYIKAKDLQG